MDNIHELLCFVLLAHFSLSPSSLATRLEDVDTTALGCYIERKWVSINLNDTTNNKLLTTDVERAAKSCSNFRIKFNHQLLLLCKLFIANFDLLRDPLPQVIPNDRVDHVNDPLSWKLGNIPDFRHIVLDLLHLHAEIKNTLYSESQVAWNMQILGRFCFNNYREINQIELHLLFFCPLTMSLRK